MSDRFLGRWSIDASHNRINGALERYKSAVETEKVKLRAERDAALARAEAAEARELMESLRTRSFIRTGSQISFEFETNEEAIKAFDVFITSLDAYDAAHQQPAPVKAGGEG